MATATSSSATPTLSSNTTPPGRSGSVARAAGIMMAAVLLSRLVGMVRDIVIAHEFGISIRTDAYNAAFTIPDFLMYLIAGGALSSTFIPVFSEYLHKEDHKGAWETFSIVATATVVIAGSFVLLAELFAPQLVILSNPGYAHDPLMYRPSHILRILLHPNLYSDPRIPLTAYLTRIVLPAQIFFLLGGLLMGTLNARNRFLVPALAPTIYNLGIIFGATALHRMGISGLMWGALGGAFIGNFALQIAYVAREGMRYRPSLWLAHPGAVRVWRMMLPILLGVSLPNVDQIINRYFSSELNLGSQTALQYAVRLMLIPIGVFAQAMGIAILPTLSALAAAGDRKNLRRTTVQGISTILFLTIPASAIMYILAEPIVTLLYRHGLFNQADVLATTSPLRFYALGIFAWSAQAVLTRAFYAVQDSRTPVISGSVMTFVFIIMNWFVVSHTHFGVAGLAMATTIAATLHMIVMFYYLNRRIGKIAGYPLLASTIKTLIATGALCVICGPVYISLSRILDMHSHPLLSIPIFVISASLGCLAYFAIARALNMSELQSAIAMVSRRRGKTTIGSGEADGPAAV